jgi:DNA-binding MarR family transcriptional regulator
MVDGLIGPLLRLPRRVSTTKENKVPSPTERRELYELLAQFTRRYRQFVVEEVRAEGFSYVQANALWILEDGPISCGTLADLLEVDASNATGVIDRLERRGLLRREPQITDRRVKLLVITPAGRASVESIRTRLAERAPPPVDELPEEEQEQFFRLLQAMMVLTRA